MSEKQTDNAASPIRSFFAEIGRSLVDGAKETLLWLLAGAAIGALALGAAGAYYFGWSGFGIGLLVGAIAGALVSLWLSSEAL